MSDFKQPSFWTQTQNIDTEESKRLIKAIRSRGKKRKQADKTRLSLTAAMSNQANQHIRDAAEHEVKAKEYADLSAAMNELANEARRQARAVTLDEIRREALAQPPRAPRGRRAQRAATPEPEAIEQETETEPGAGEDFDDDEMSAEGAETGGDHGTEEGVPADASPITDLANTMSSATVSSPGTSPRSEGAPAVPQSSGIRVATTESVGAIAVFQNTIGVPVTAENAEGVCTICRDPFRVGNNARTGPNCVRKGAGGVSVPAHHLMHESCAIRQFDSLCVAFGTEASERDERHPGWRGLGNCNVCRAPLVRLTDQPSSTSATMDSDA